MYKVNEKMMKHSLSSRCNKRGRRDDRGGMCKVILTYMCRYDVLLLFQ